MVVVVAVACVGIWFLSEIEDFLLLAIVLGAIVLIGIILAHLHVVPCFLPIMSGLLC